jgi:anti-sigma B factor antagonist
LNTRIERHGAATVVVAGGRLDFSAAASFQAQLEQLLAGAGGALIIDCAQLDYVSSAGLRVFLLAARGAQRAGRYFAVCALQSAVREVFDLSGFGRVMPVLADRDSALAAASAAPAPA